MIRNDNVLHIIDSPYSTIRQLDFEREALSHQLKIHMSLHNQLLYFHRINYPVSWTGR
jgi:hypothetical protein